MSFTSIVISAAVTGYARIHMSKYRLDIFNNGGNIYYSDTDSLVTNVKLDDSLVGKGLGLMKLEYMVKKGIFISGKTYCLITDEDKLITKAKGLKSSSLVYNDYVSLLNNIDVKGIKTVSNTDWEKGEVSIEDKSIVLNHNSYTKRQKIYKDGRWIDTKPIYLESNISLHHLFKIWIRKQVNRIEMLSLAILLLLCYIISLLVADESVE